MPIICEPVDNVKKGAMYMSDKEFVHAYPKPNPDTPLGSSWQFAPCFLPKKYVDYKDEIQMNFNVRPDGVFCIAFPKSGLNWSQQMIWLLNNDLDYASSEKYSINDRFMQLQLDICFKSLSIGVLERINAFPSPRHLKSHLPAGLLPAQIWTVKPKIIYVSRGTKDSAVSYFHHYKNVHLSDASRDEFMEAFADNQIIFSPQHNHIKDFWFMRDEENILFLTYEEMKRNLFDVLKRISQFLGKNYSDDQLHVLEQYLSFESMKSTENKSFKMQAMKIMAEAEGLDHKVIYENISGLRKGVVGGHKEEMSTALINRFDELTEQFNANNGTSILP